jgi:hypothetical protein
LSVGLGLTPRPAPSCARVCLAQECNMDIKKLRIGQCVRHPEHDGTGDVTRIEPDRVEVFFNHGKMTLGKDEIEKLIPLDSIDTSMVDLGEIVDRSVHAALASSRAESAATEMSKKFQGGVLVIRPADPHLPEKEVSLETFFHKIVMVRDSLRVLEQKINAHKVLTEQEKVDLQQYLTRMAGSLTTFNGLFREREAGF